MRKHKFYFDGSNANFAEVLNAISFIFEVDVLPFLKGTANTANLVSSFRSFDDYPQDIIEPSSSKDKEAYDKGIYNTLQAAYKKNNVYDLVSLWDKMRTYFLDNANSKNFTRSLYDVKNTYTYTVTDKPKVIILPPSTGTDTGTGTGASNPTETGAGGTNTGTPTPSTPPAQDASRDEKLKYFTQSGNSKGYTWEQSFKRDWYAMANTLNVLDRAWVKQHIDFMINQQKSNPTGAKDNSKDEIQDFKQAVEFVPTVNRNKFKIKKGFLFYLFASPKAKAAIKAEEEKKYNEAVQKEEEEFIQAETNQLQKNANIKKLIKDKTIILTPYLTALNALNKAPKPKNLSDTKAMAERQQIVNSLANLQIVKDSPRYKQIEALIDPRFKGKTNIINFEVLFDIFNSKVNEINGQINELKKQLK